MADIKVEIDRHVDELQALSSKYATLTGKEHTQSQRKRAADDGPEKEEETKTERPEKRPRITVGSTLFVDSTPHRRRESRDGEADGRRPTVSSSIHMPTIETKSRAEILAEQRKTGSTEDEKRNRRLFGGLLMGTLRQFQKEETPKNHQSQTKLREIEERLAKQKEEHAAQYQNERREVVYKMKEKELQIQRLRQKQAIKARCDAKVEHYQHLQNFIQTETKPVLFYLPARHTLRTMELLKGTERNIETLIKERKEEADDAIRELDELSDGEISPAVRSAVRLVSNEVNNGNNNNKAPKHEVDDKKSVKSEPAEPEEEFDDDDSDDEDVFKVRSVVVVKKPAGAAVDNGSSTGKPGSDVSASTKTTTTAAAVKDGNSSTNVKQVSLSSSGGSGVEGVDVVAAAKDSGDRKVSKKSESKDE